MFPHVVDEHGCWIWQGAMDSNGYGRIKGFSDSAGQRIFWAHRASFAHHRGLIPPGYEIDHVCEVTACINPDHLETVTRSEHCLRTYRRLGKDDRHLSAATLRIAGMTYGEIAAALGYSGRAAAAGAVRTALSKGLIDADDLPAFRWLSAADYEAIRELHTTGTSHAEIARRFGCDAGHVSRICNGLRKPKAVA